MKKNTQELNAGGLKDAAGNALDLGGSKVTQTIPTKNGTIQVIDKLLH